jgi:indole-3-glycerol phosphate synthase
MNFLNQNNIHASNRMNLLQKIANVKHRQVEVKKSEVSFAKLEKSEFFGRQPLSLSKALIDKRAAAVIAEFKRRSPSAGIINDHADPAQVCLTYENAGSSAVSVLTDFRYFGGSSGDLSEVRNTVGCPILCKDFIVDEYQIVEAKAIGADAVLLIAELNKAGRLEELFRFACSLGLEVLVEIHEEKNISRLPYDAVIVGINNRNLSSFVVNIEHSSKLVSSLPRSVIKVAESGIRSVADCIQLSETGFDAFLIGEYFMRSCDPGKECKDLIAGLKEKVIRVRKRKDNHE